MYHNNYYNNSVLPIYEHDSLKSFLHWFSTCGSHCLLCLLSALHGIEMYLILVHFIQLVLPLPLHEYKDQTLVEGKYQYMIFFFKKSWAILGGNNSIVLLFYGHLTLVFIGLHIFEFDRFKISTAKMSQMFSFLPVSTQRKLIPSSINKNLNL